MSSNVLTTGLMIKCIQHRNLRRLDAQLAPLGISLVQWNALRSIDRNPQSCMHRLAELTFNSDQAFGTLATRLRKLRLIERRRGVGRTALHAITPKGKELLDAGFVHVRSVLSQTFAPLSQAEYATLDGLLAKLLDGDYPEDL